MYDPERPESMPPAGSFDPRSPNLRSKFCKITRIWVKPDLGSNPSVGGPDHSRRSTRDVMARDRVAPMLHPLLVRVARSLYPFVQS
jgi:hypothetical protein